MNECEAKGCRHLETRCVICARLANFIIMPKANEWINVKDRLPDAVKQYVVVFAPKGLYENDSGLPSYHILYWYKIGFSEEAERNQEILQQITHWIPLPETPKEDL